METNKLIIAELNKRLESLRQKTFDILKFANQDELKTRLEKELLELQERTNLKLAFIGQYSSGKSTIISALTGNRDIKIDANVATDIVSEYKWNNISLLDTPGILAGKTEQHDQQTKDALKECDLIVYVLTSQLFDDVIFENFIDLAYTQKLDDKILIAINKMSMESGNFQKLKDNYSQSIKDIFRERGYEFNFPIVYIDAADYIEGIDLKDNEFIQLSNFSAFVSHLNSFVEEKGLIKKQFDTPVRILKGCISDIAISEIDPNLRKQIDAYVSRINKSMADMERAVKLELNRFESESLSSIMDISSFIGEIDENAMRDKTDQLTLDIENKINGLVNSIERIIEQKYNDLTDDMTDFENKEVFIFHRRNLDAKLNSPSISLEDRKSLENQKKLLEYFSLGGQKLSGMSGVSNLFGGMSQASGDTLHTSVYGIGKFFGHKFKPWGAVKVASNVGKFAKFGVPIISGIISVGLEMYSHNQENKRAKNLDAAKQQFNANLRSNIKSIRQNIEDNFNKDIIGNYKNKLDEINKIKLEVSRSINKNEKINKAISDFDSEYVDFIEII